MLCVLVMAINLISHIFLQLIYCQILKSQFNTESFHDTFKILFDFRYKHLPEEEWSPPQKVEFKEVVSFHCHL